MCLFEFLGVNLAPPHHLPKAAIEVAHTSWRMMGSGIFKVGFVALYLHGATAAPVTGILDKHNEFR